MFASHGSAAAAYSRVGLESGVASADPHRLILMLLDGAILSVNSAAASMAARDFAGQGQSISKAIEIIGEGLKASLDLQTGGELAHRLAALYDYMVSRLLFANMRSNAAALKEVSHLLSEIKSGWESIGQV